MQAGIELGLQGVHDKALTGDAALAFEGCGYHFYNEMGLATLVPAAMSAVALAVIHHVQLNWRQLGEECRLNMALAGGSGRRRQSHLASSSVGAGEAIWYQATRNADCQRLAGAHSSAHNRRIMDSYSKLFDKLRIKPDKESVARDQFPPCEWAGCESAGAYRAPKGRGREGQYHHFCLEHVQLYNKSYNYFSGMGDDAVIAFQKDALTGHRPTWTVSVNRWGQTDPNAGHHRKPAEPSYNDPFGVFHGSRAGGPRVEPEEPRRHVSPMTQRAFETLHLEVGVSKDEIKAQYKVMVKRHHPDANGGDRSSEERLREIIQAYNYLKTAGFC
jgi:hypothetical protein